MIKKLFSSQLRVNSFWIVLGMGIYTITQWGILVLLARLGSAEDVGRFGLGLAISAPVVLVFGLQLRLVIATDTFNDYDFSDYLTLGIITSVLGFMFVSSITWGLGYRGEKLLVIVLIGVAKSVETIIEICIGLYQKCERMGNIAASYIIRGTLGLLAMTIVFWSTRSLVWTVAAMAIVWLLFLVLYESRRASLFAHLKLSTNFRKIRILLVRSSPLGLSVGLICLCANLPKYFIEHYLGDTELGYFVAMTWFVLAFAKLVDSIGHAASPRLAKYYVEHRVSYVRLLLKLTVVAVILGGSGIFFTIVAGKWFLALLYGEDYAKYSYVLVWLFVAGTVSYIFSMFDKAIVAAQHFRLRFLVIVLGTITMAVSCYLLVPRFGLTGGATAKIAAAISMLAYGILVICWSLLRQPLVSIQNEKQ